MEHTRIDIFLYTSRGKKIEKLNTTLPLPLQLHHQRHRW
jgi:hypothetical protein